MTGCIRFMVAVCAFIAIANSWSVLAMDVADSRKMYLTANDVLLFHHSLQFIKDTNCRRDLNATLWGLQNHAMWAVTMYDASVRHPVGIASGVLYQFGHYDQCMKMRRTQPWPPADSPEHVVMPQYCLVEVEMDEMMEMDNTLEQRPLTSHWGECMPSTCSGADVAIYLHHTLQRNVTVNANMCQQSGHNELPITNGMIAYAVILAFFIALTALSTGYHVFLLKLNRQEDDVVKTAKRSGSISNMALLSFSLIENTKKLFQASRDHQGLNPINGIKAWAMLFILCGHAAAFIYGIPLYNMDFLSENIKAPQFGYITNSFLFVDVFLLLSGYLFFRILFAELERRRGKLNPLILYIGRYIRLTPAYLAVIGFYMTWFIHIGDGPLWQHRIQREQERCESSWWLNLLYINNYFKTDKLCMFQSWYLSADTQLFFVAPIIIYLTHRSRKQGVRLMSALVVITSLIPFVVTFVQDLPPTFMLNPQFAEYIPGSEYYRNTYVKTHMRASAYFIGLLTGYLAHVMHTKSVKLPKYLVRLLWTLGCVLGVGSMFSLFRFYVAPYTNIESTLYAGFHRLAWNLANAWLVLAVTTGHGGWLQRLLSLRVFVPFSRLTYCAYLVNGIVELMHTSGVRTADYLNVIQMENNMLCHMTDTFLVAFLLCLIFESPIHALERILMRTFAIGERNKPAVETSSDATPSTSEEQVA